MNKIVLMTEKESEAHLKYEENEIGFTARVKSTEVRGEWRKEEKLCSTWEGEFSAVQERSVLHTSEWHRR